MSGASAGDDRTRRRARWWTGLSLATGIGSVMAAQVDREGARHIVAPHQAAAEWALVLGSRAVHGPTPVLIDRVTTAVELLRSGRVRRLVLSGSTAASTGDEVGAMLGLALAAGVSPADIDLDQQGRHTFESLVEARRAGRSPLVVVTQRFHLPRALYLAENLGLRAVGVPADLRDYAGIDTYRAREKVSRVLAYWLVRG